jgi:hypothetical protein
MQDLPTDISFLLKDKYFDGVSLYMLKHTDTFWNKNIKDIKVPHRQIAYKGQLSILQSLFEFGWRPSKWTFAYAAKGGHINVLEWLHSVGCPGTECASNYAAYNGHNNVLKWLASKGYPFGNHCVTYAASGGHLELVKLLEMIDVHSYENLFQWAIYGNNSDVINWCFSENIYISEVCASAAMKKGSCDLLRRLLDADANLMTEPMTRIAVINNRMDMLELMDEEDLIDLPCLVQMSIYKNNLKILRWAKNQGYEIIVHDKIKAHIQNCKNKRMLKWLTNNKYV